MPQGPFDKSNSLIKRLVFLEAVVDSFWEKWSQNYFPSLLIQQKWHHTKRNTDVGDIVVIQDNSTHRGKWKLGKVTKVTLGIDNISQKSRNTVQE